MNCITRDSASVVASGRMLRVVRKKAARKADVRDDGECRIIYNSATASHTSVKCTAKNPSVC